MGKGDENYNDFELIHALSLDECFKKWWYSIYQIQSLFLYIYSIYWFNHKIPSYFFFYYFFPN